jgi:cell division ATPase FtsA
MVAVFYFSLIYDYIRVSMNDRDFGDYVQKVVDLAAENNYPTSEVRKLLLVRADDLGLPLTGGQILIQGLSKSLSVSVDYEVDIHIPFVSRGVYVKRYSHKAKYRLPR